MLLDASKLDLLKSITRAQAKPKKGAGKRAKKNPKVADVPRKSPTPKSKPTAKPGATKGKYNPDAKASKEPKAKTPAGRPKVASRLQKSMTYADAFHRALKEDLGQGAKRYAYNISHTTDPSEVVYIPVNRLKMVYQTDEATDWDKVKENMDRMRNGEALEPVVIGYDHDVHDGHHRWIASKGLDYTHVPCIVGGTNEVERQRAMEGYRELWKSMLPEDRKYISPQEGAQYIYDAVIEDCTPSEAWGNIKKRADWDAGEAPEFIHHLKKLSPKRWKSFLCDDAIEYVRRNMDEGFDELMKSIIEDPTSEGTEPYSNGDMMFRGIGQKEMDFINEHGYIQTKGKGNDDDKERATCFSNLFSQAEGYARSNYDLYNEKQAYVLIVPKPPWIEEDEHGELVSKKPVPAVPMIVIEIPKPE